MDEQHFQGEFAALGTELPPEAVTALQCPFSAMNKEEYAWVVGVLYKAPKSDPDDVSITREELESYSSKHIIGATWYKDHNYSERIGSIQKYWYNPQNGKLWVGVLVNNDTEERRDIVKELRAGKLRHMSIGILKKEQLQKNCRSYKSILEGSFTNDPKIPKCDILYCHSNTNTPTTTTTTMTTTVDVLSELSAMMEESNAPAAEEEQEEESSSSPAEPEQEKAKPARTQASKNEKLREKAVKQAATEASSSSSSKKEKLRKGDPAYLLQKRKKAIAAGKSPTEVGAAKDDNKADLMEKFRALGERMTPKLMAQLVQDPDTMFQMVEQRERENEKLRNLVAASNAKYASKRHKEGLGYMKMLVTDGVFNNKEHESELRAFHSNYLNRDNAHTNRAIHHFATGMKRSRDELAELKKEHATLQKEHAKKEKLMKRMNNYLAVHVDRSSLPAGGRVMMNANDTAELNRPRATIMAHNKSRIDTALDQYFDSCPAPNSSKQPVSKKQKQKEEAVEGGEEQSYDYFKNASSVLGTKDYSSYLGATGENSGRTAELMNNMSKSSGNFMVASMLERQRNTVRATPFYHDRKLRKPAKKLAARLKAQKA